MNAEFWHMGGYALYVWSSFGVTLAFLVIEPLVLRQRRVSMLKRIKRIKRMQSGGGS